MFSDFKKMVFHPIKFRMFLFLNLPAAFFSGIRVKSLSEKQAQVTVKYKWRTTNPFRSTYFACLAMAAEMSTGVLAMAYLYKIRPQISMLIVENTARYYKKATGITTFICNNGEDFYIAIQQAIQNNQAVEFTAHSTGTSALGEIVAEFSFTWSFKPKLS
ncbi:MAG: DUF4442 domain-containing protein [Ferruginibacter sp.]|nr:DUF4442 domain-containing protein [Ferruginibacter sp.]